MCLMHLSIDPVASDRIRNDSVASIATIGLLGDKYIEVSLGTASGTPLEDGAVLKTRSPLALGDVIDKGTVALDRIAHLAETVDGVVTDFSDSMGATHVSETTAAIAEFMREIREGEGLFHSLIYDEYEGKGVESIGRSLATLEQILGEIAEGDGLLHSLIYAPPEEQEGLQEVVSAARRLNSILTKVDEGEGTVGLLVTDPTLYEDMKRLLDGAERSVVIRSLIDLAKDDEEAAKP